MAGKDQFKMTHYCPPVHVEECVYCGMPVLWGEFFNGDDPAGAMYDGQTRAWHHTYCYAVVFKQSLHEPGWLKYEVEEADKPIWDSLRQVFIFRENYHWKEFATLAEKQHQKLRERGTSRKNVLQPGESK